MNQNYCNLLSADRLAATNLAAEQSVAHCEHITAHRQNIWAAVFFETPPHICYREARKIACSMGAGKLTALAAARLKHRPHDRKTASQTQLAASLTQRFEGRSGTNNVGVMSPRLQSVSHRPSVSNQQ